MVQQLLLLGILLRGKMHGYRLNEYVAHAMSLYTDITKSTVYYTLDKLEKEGYVEHMTEREGKRPERRVYQINKKGEECFFGLLREHLSNYERTFYADDVGIAFMDRLPAVEAHRLLTGKREKLKTILQQFREHPEHGGNWHYVVSHNIAHLKADFAWVNNILSELDKADS
ncbi:PadR family transcriptional regulator [Chloroflexota bacterium]